MKPRHKVYLKLNLMSIVFIVVSFISATLAWFAYSGLSNVSTEVGVKAWYIELEKDGQKVSNDIVISLSDIYPGMDTVNESVKIKNMGDSDAQVKYEIVSARILDKPEDNYTVNDETTSSFVEDALSHNYPFHININLTRGYALAKDGESIFEVSVSWPLDSDSDAFDSLWGTEAYKFQKSENDKKSQDENYQVRPSIQVVISVTAEQYLEEDSSSDIHYNLGDTILFDVINNTRCTQISPTCLKTYVIDTKNTLKDETVKLLPDPTNTYQSGVYNDYNTMLENITNGWAVNTEALSVNDLLNVISTDIINSFLIREGISDSIIGSLKYNNRIGSEIPKAINYNGYYKFLNQKFSYLSTNTCYWTNSEYNVDNVFAIKSIDTTSSKIYSEMKTSNCKVIPVIIANKSNL